MGLGPRLIACFLLGSFSVSQASPLESCRDKMRQVFSAESRTKFKEGSQKYWGEVKSSRGLRLLVKDVGTEEAEVDRRVLLFWMIPREAYSPALSEEASYWHRISQDLRSIRNAPQKHLDVWGGINAAHDAPLRFVSRELVKRGLIGSEKRWAFLGLLLVTAPLYGYPFEEIRKWGTEKKRESLKKSLERDVRYKQVRGDLDELLSESGKKLSEEDQRRLWKKIENKVKIIHQAYDEYYDFVKKKSRNPIKSKQELDAYYEHLASSPLFESIPRELGVKSFKDIPEDKKRGARILMSLREHLYLRFQLVPKLFEEETPRLESVEVRKEMNSIRSDPFTRDVLKAYRERRISQERATYFLMQDAYVDVELFAGNRARKDFGFHPYEVDPTRALKETQAAARLEMGK